MKLLKCTVSHSDSYFVVECTARSYCVTWYFECLHFPVEACVTYVLATALCNDPKMTVFAK